MRLRVLTWNLLHGRSVPGAGRDLCPEFTAALHAWEWDIALLQEVPPWWPAALADALGCEARAVLTSRNELLPLRRAVARRFPDVIKSGGGGANAILARADRIVAHRSQRLCRWPERRWVHGAGLACGVWVANLHATAGDAAAARHDVDEAARAARAWACEGHDRLVLGGDLNLRSVQVDGLRVLASHEVDHVLAGEGVAIVGDAETLERGALSDHAPLAVTLSVQLG
jgi:endonuclease/exonuclease/phosphatase family metal-dependent hydrolase